MQRILLVLSCTLLGLGLLGTVWFLLTILPHNDPQPVVAPLLAANNPEGMQRLAEAKFAADYSALYENFAVQEWTTFCGVASSVAVLNALGQRVNQESFFNRHTRNIRSRLSVMAAGMTLPDITALLRAHQLQVQAQHADEFTLAEFREQVKLNLADPNNYLVVNYQRAELGQTARGHLSPVSAYHAPTDSILIMDTAAYKYPKTWVPMNMLYNAMRTMDEDSDQLRGYLEVAQP